MPVAVKVSDVGRSDTRRKKRLDKAFNEINLLKQFKHPNIVAVDAVFADNSTGVQLLYVQMPLYEDDLKAWLNHHSPIAPPTPLRKIVLGLIRAVVRVHEFDQTHNDIKLDQGSFTVLCQILCERVRLTY